MAGASVFLGVMVSMGAGCSRSELSAFGDPQAWQLAFPCADNRYASSEVPFTLEARSLTDQENTWATPCSAADVGSGPDETILWEAPAAGRYRIRAVMNNAALGLFVLRDGCDAEVPACGSSFGSAEIEVDVAAGESLLIVVDAITDADAGTYTLEVTPG
jgi:hypothetical protein